MRTPYPGQNANDSSDFTSAPVLVSLILGGILLLLLVICRAYILFRRRKTRPSNAHENTTTVNQTSNGPPMYPDEPPSYEHVGMEPVPGSDLDVPGVYLNMPVEEDDAPPPKYYEVMKERPALTTITDSAK